MKVLFHEAKSEAGTDFDAHTPDTYKAVYAVEPVSSHPAYRVSRNITVKSRKQKHRQRVLLKIQLVKEMPVKQKIPVMRMKMLIRTGQKKL